MPDHISNAIQIPLRPYYLLSHNQLSGFSRPRSTEPRICCVSSHKFKPSPSSFIQKIVRSYRVTEAIFLVTVVLHNTPDFTRHWREGQGWQRALCTLGWEPGVRETPLSVYPLSPHVYHISDSLQLVCRRAYRKPESRIVTSSGHFAECLIVSTYEHHYEYHSAKTTTTTTTILKGSDQKEDAPSLCHFHHHLESSQLHRNISLHCFLTCLVLRDFRRRGQLRSLAWGEEKRSGAFVGSVELLVCTWWEISNIAMDEVFRGENGTEKYSKYDWIPGQT